MMQFAGDYSGREEHKKLKARQNEDETVRATRLLSQQHRQEQQKQRLGKQQAALRQLTFKNIEAYESSAVEETEPEQFETVDQSKLQGKQLSTHFEAGRKLAAAGDLNEACAILKECVILARGDLKSTIDVCLALGLAQLKSDDMRESIQSLYYGLVLCKNMNGDKSTIISFLNGLITASSDIGKAADAARFRDELTQLRSTHQVAVKPAQQIVKSPNVEMPESLRESLDLGIEAALKGQFSLLRSFLNAFKKPRAGVSLIQIVGYQHSKTAASPLMVCAAKGEINLVRALLIAGAPVELCAADGSTALVWACRFNQPVSVSMLLESGSQFDASVDAAMISSWSSEVQTAVAGFVNKQKENVEDNERKLHRWNSSEEHAVAKGALEDGSHDKDWNQFEANSKLGVKPSSFDESLYTTALDVDKIPADVRAKAEALCKEMESDKKKNNDLDEESAHSAVLRVDPAVIDEDGFTDASVLRKKKGKKKK